MPSYNGILTVSCIRTLAQTALKLSDSISFEHICKLIEPFRNSDTILQVRMEASRALLDIEYQSKGISSALSLFMQYVVEEPSLRGQVKLCVHTMRLCQLAVGGDSDDYVGIVSLLDLLHFFKSPVVFNNEFLRHHLFCIFQVLAGRPPTLFGVPKEKPLQLVDVEACIEPQNIYSVPGPEAGGPSLSAFADAQGKSLDVTPFGVPMRSHEFYMPVVPELKLPEPVAASLYETQHVEPQMENQDRDQLLPENPIVHEIPSDAETPTEELAQREADTPKEPKTEPDETKEPLVSMPVSHEVKKSVIRIKVRPSGATSRAEGSARSMERSQGLLVVRHDIDRGQTSSASVDAPHRISIDAVSICNQNNIEEVNSCHDVGSRMTASIGSVKFLSEGDTSGKELQCTAESGKTSTSHKAEDNNQTTTVQDDSVDKETQKYASLQTLSVGKEKEKKKDKGKKEKKRKRDDPGYRQKKRLKKEKKQKEKELAKILSSSADQATANKLDSDEEEKQEKGVVEVRAEEAEVSARLIMVEAKAEPSTAEAPRLPKIKIKLKSKALNN